MNDCVKQVLDILNLTSFITNEDAEQSTAAGDVVLTWAEDDHDPLLNAWRPPVSIKEFVQQPDGSPMESLTRVRLLLGHSIWQEEFGVNMQAGLERLMHSLATGDGWMDERGWGGEWAEEDGDGSVPFALCWSLYSCAAAYRICIQKGDATQAAKILPWYARAVLLLRFCCPRPKAIKE